jgi:hypothetical protein
MRLARTAPPLPRDLVGRTRTCDLRFPKPVGCQAPLRPVAEPPAGLEPAASGLRIRRHPVSTTGARGSGGRNRTCALAGNNRASYRLDHAGTYGDSRIRTCETSPPYAVARRCLTARPCLQEEGEGIEPPRPFRTHPFSKRDTAPVAVLPKWPPQASNLQPPD